MQKYIERLIADIEIAGDHLSWPFKDEEYLLSNWVTDEEEEKIAPVRSLEKWTGIYKDSLPTQAMLNDDQLHELLSALIKLLCKCNCYFVLQTRVPVRIQYEVIRDNFSQDIKLKHWHMGFFALCRPGTEPKKCTLREHCQCAIFEELFAGFVDEDLTAEEEREREWEIEIKHLKRKYDDYWMKYYPYHLDKNFDDEHGNPYDYR